MKDTRIVQFKEWECSLEIEKYKRNSRMAITLIGNKDDYLGEPIAVATVNVPHIILDENEVVIKSYSENENLLESLIKAGIVEDTNRVVPLGYQYGNIVKYLNE